jgi:hypothetical protein
MKDTTIIILAAMLCITVLDFTAMVLLHIDGVVLSATVGILAGLGGYNFKSWKSTAAEEKRGALNG